MELNYKKGIYKITSPSGKVYIGKSKCFHKRWISYINLHCKKQVRLYNSFMKYGMGNHKFEIIEECYESQLYNREIFYKRKFIKELGWENVLFCHINDGKGKPKPKGFKDKYKKVILQYDLEGNFIREWSSITEAENYFRPGRKRPGDVIGIACRLGGRRTAYKYKWKFKNHENKNTI